MPDDEAATGRDGAPGEDAPGEGDQPSAVREVRRLHGAIEDWFTGASDDLAPFADALAAEFRIVSPDGTTRTREEVVGAMRGARGSHADETPPFVVEVRDVALRHAAGDLALVTYEEHQRTDGAWRGRTSSAWLRADDGAPGGVAWVHLHETWLGDGTA